jgi:chromosomal replication initiation ATPase DnaA
MNPRAYRDAIERAKKHHHDWTGTNTAAVDDILFAVCDVTGADPAAVAGDRRFAHLMAARFLWWACLRDVMGWSYPVIGIYVDRDHSTVIHGIKQVPVELVHSMRPVIELRAANQTKWAA